MASFNKVVLASAASSSSSASSSSVSSQHLNNVVSSLVKYYVYAFGPLLIDRRFNVGFFREADTPWFWALALISFSLGGLVVNWLTGSWYFKRYFLNRSSQQQARLLGCCLFTYVGIVISTGLVYRLGSFLLIRFITGFLSALWTECRTRMSLHQSSLLQGKGSISSSGGGVKRTNASLVVEGILINPAWCLGAILGKNPSLRS